MNPIGDIQSQHSHAMTCIIIEHNARLKPDTAQPTPILRQAEYLVFDNDYR
jgi:hypothetical protein